MTNPINKSGHAASVEDFSVLDRANNDFDLLIHESLLILRDRPSLNSQQSSIPLALFVVLSSGCTSLFIFHEGFVKNAHLVVHCLYRYKYSLLLLET